HIISYVYIFFFFSSRRRHTRFSRDWSSDVCSSDLDRPRRHRRQGPGGGDRVLRQRLRCGGGAPRGRRERRRGGGPHQGGRLLHRSEERRVGKEGRCRWTPYHYKKKSNRS